MACLCAGCGRDTDCGADKLCELCLANRPAQSRMDANTELASTVERPFILIDGQKIVGHTMALGWKKAVKVLQPSSTQRLAMIIDVPRE